MILVLLLLRARRKGDVGSASRWQDVIGLASATRHRVRRHVRAALGKICSTPKIVVGALREVCPAKKPVGVSNNIGDDRVRYDGVRNE